MLRQSPATATAMATESAMDAHTEASDFLMVAPTDAPMEDMVATDVATTARGRLRLLLRLRLLTVTDTDFLMEGMDAPMEDMVAMDVATTARGRLRLLLRLLTVTDTDFLMEVMGAHTEATDFLMAAPTDAPMEDMVATDVATTARGRPRLRLLLRLTLLTDTVMAAPMEAMAAPMEDTVAMAGPMAAMVALTGMATESRQQPEQQHHMNNLKFLNMNWTKYKFSLSKKKKKKKKFFFPKKKKKKKKKVLC